ncbi:hypothetical protein KBA63_00105 [Candidatus Woesebacteria bacterium]|nr:hypothetical protein [Candidatus Woesebacteria bacterium]
MPKVTRETPLTGKTKSGKILSEQEELFCNLYVARYDRIEAVVESYNVDKSKPNWRYTASNIAYENLLRPYINERIRELLDEFHLNDENVDMELATIIQQNAEISSKNKAIDTYNRLRGRYEKDNQQKAPVINVVKYAE